jgi:hypothetical protein
MDARKIYESLEDYGFSKEEIIKFIEARYGDTITVELEYQRQDPHDCTEYLFDDLNANVTWHASDNDIEEFDLGSRWLTFTITGSVKDIVDVLLNWWGVFKDSIYEYIKDTIIL